MCVCMCVWVGVCDWARALVCVCVYVCTGGVYGACVCALVRVCGVRLVHVPVFVLV